MSSEFHIKKYENTDTTQYIQQLHRKALMQFSREDIQKAHEAYESYKRSILPNTGANNKTNLTDITPLNSFHLSNVHANVHIPSHDEMTQSVDIQRDRSNIVSTTSATDLQRFSEVSINSPLWAISQNSRLKQEIDAAIQENKKVKSRSAIDQTSDPFQSTMKQLFNQLVSSGKLTIENGKVSCSYQGQKFVFDIPPEWNMNTTTSEAKEALHPSQENIERDASWNQIITNAIDKSPGAMVDKLPEDIRAEVLRKEWLVDEPLTGICTGLALEFLLETELNGSPQSILPSDESRYWEKLLIPVMEKVMQLYYSDHPDQLNQERHYRAVYEQMINVIEKKAHLKASIQSLHVPLYQLGEKLQSTQGHALVIIELPGTPVAASHTIYFNATDRSIEDNGVIIHVPKDDNYGAFVDFYMEKMKYHNRADRFTLISIIKDPQFNTVHKSSMMDRIFLSTEITFNYLLKQIMVPNSSLKGYDVMQFNPYSSY